MPKKLNPKEEIMTLIAVKETKEGSIDEVQAKMKEKWKTEVSKELLVRYLRRWRKIKAISANLVGDVWVYSWRDVPFWPIAQMVHVLKPDISDADATEFLENYKDELKERGFAQSVAPKIRDYKTYKVRLQITDRIAGGLLPPNGEEIEEENPTLEFPKLDGKPVIPRNWTVGWFRDNARLANLGKNTVRDHVATSIGTFEGKPEIEVQTRIGMKGPKKYETIGPGAIFTFNLSWPSHGWLIQTKDQLEGFFKRVETTPIRGFGANNKAFGGGVKLLSLKELA